MGAMDDFFAHANNELGQAEGTNEGTGEGTVAGLPASRGVSDENARGRGAGWPAWALGALESMRQVPSITRAAERVGVDRRTVHRLMEKSGSFREAMAEAREDALDQLEEIVLLRARQGQPVRKTITKTLKDGSKETIVTEETHISDNLAMFYLKRWRLEYRDSFRVEQSGPDGGPIMVSVEEKLREGVGRFNAEVVRLADARAARDAAS